MTGISSVFHKNNLLSDLSAVRHDKIFCDILLKAEDNVRIAAHRVVLMASSNYFKAMFSSGMIESDMQEVALNEFDGVALERIVDFLYTGKVEIQPENVEMFLQAAEYFQIDSLTEELTTFIGINMNIWNWAFFLDIFERYNYIELIDKAHRYLWNNINEISKTQDFFQLSYHNMMRMMQSDYLNISREDSLFVYLKKWINYDEQRQMLVPTLLPLLRLSQMSSDFIVKNIQPMCNCDELNQLIDSTLNWLKLNAKDRTMANDLPSSWMKKRQSDERILVVVDATIQEYCFKKETWKIFADIPNGHDDSNAVLLNGDLYLIGGTHYGPKCHRFEIKSKIWTEIPDLNSLYIHPVLASFNGQIYAICGQNNSPNEPASTIFEPFYGGRFERISYPVCFLQRYCPIKNTWKRLIKIDVAKYSLEMAQGDQCLYCLNGCPESPPHNATICRGTGSISLLRRPVIIQRHNFGVVLDKNELFVIGGGTDSAERTNLDGFTNCDIVEGSSAVQKCIIFKNKLIAIGNNVVFEWSTDRSKWCRSESIMPLAGNIFRGAFSVKSQFFS